MRSTALNTLFFALFALSSVGYFSEVHTDKLSDFFAAVAYAAPADPQGAISKRQGCMGPLCRFAAPTTSSSDSNNDAAPVIYDVITKLLGLLSNTPGAPQPTAVTASGRHLPPRRSQLVRLNLYPPLGTTKNFENTEIISWTKP
ncbi:hypothetical protein BJV77DRAFT_1095993 [Russula vinacea]|nr:hypothetical protein BJV77DRAFT_1095993 [Russula vinacea]